MKDRPKRFRQGNRRSDADRLRLPTATPALGVRASRSGVLLAVRHDLLAANPMDRINTIKVARPLPRPAAAADIAKELGATCGRWPRKRVPLDRLRDRVLFETAYVYRARTTEVCARVVDDLDRSPSGPTSTRLAVGVHAYEIEQNPPAAHPMTP